MKHLASILLLAVAMPVAAQSLPLPSCWPGQIGGTGTEAVYAQTEDAEGYAWRCPRAEHPQRICKMKAFSLVHPPTVGLTPIGSARAFWRANATANCATDPRFRALDHLLYQAAPVP